ncbi:MAG: hypothetical protein LBF62_09040 [Tannerellaceae bacterium]|nr:hypothetical protein [Tannerellaceae bacterium]
MAFFPSLLLTKTGEKQTIYLFIPGAGGFVQDNAAAQGIGAESPDDERRGRREEEDL